MGLTDPKNLTDDELREDIQAAKKMSADIFASDSVNQAVKDDLKQHIKGLLRELEQRTGETPYSLSNLGVDDL